MGKWKRVTALLLSVAIMLSLLPAGALAAEPQEDTDAEETFITLEEEDIFESSDAADNSDTVESVLQEESRTGARIAADNGGDAEDEPAYEVSYNLSGSGYWVTVGSDETLKDEASYQLFDEDGDYVIQLREDDTFPYRVEMRSRTEKNALWSVPETVTFTRAGETKEFAGHKFTAHSKWKMQIRYKESDAGWSENRYVSANGYDSDGNYAINLLPNDIRFPMTMNFQYSYGTSYDSGGWTDFEIPTADGKGTTTDIVFNDMNASADVMGHIFTLHSDLLGMAQYSVDDTNNWKTVGAGQKQEFDKNGNYTIDMGSRKKFPITVYLRYLDVDGWKYVGNADNTAASHQDYRNVLDTASVGGHVFAIHTDWMYDVKYAIVEEGDIVSGHIVVPKDNSGRWKTVGVGEHRNDIDDHYDESGNYEINIMTDAASQKFPLQILFKAISPKGEWLDDGDKWEDENKLKDHLRTYSDVNDIKQFESHDFSLSYADLNEVRYRIYTKYSSETKNYSVASGWFTVGISQTRAEQNQNYKLFDKFGNYNISLTDEDLESGDGLFPLRVEFRWMETDGWKEEQWEIPFSGRNGTKLINTHTFGFNPLDFLDDVRYQRDGDDGWMYFIPDPGEGVDPKKVRYYPNYSVYTTDETGTSYGVIPMRESDTFEKISDNKYLLKPSVTFQIWDPESGWITETIDGYNSLNDSRIVKTCLDIPHTFTLRPVYGSEVRYSLTSADGPWTVVGYNQTAAQEAKEKDSENPSYVLFNDMGNYAISLPRDTLFPVRAFFEVYTQNGWVKASGTQLPRGTGTFQNASGTLSVTAGSVLHIFSVSYPWADSVSYTFEDRQPQVTYTVGSDRAYAETDDTYFYAAPGSMYTIELDEGDFFPVKISFSTTDSKGQVSRQGAQPQSHKVENYTYEFTTNQSGDTYTVGGYTFNVNSNWMETVRIYLPERTISVGTGGGSVTPEWLEKNKNYNLFDTDDSSYTIPLRPSDTFPLEVEFLKRSVNADPRPTKHTFENVTDTFIFDDHTFKLNYDFSDTVRYILAYDEDVADDDGNLNPVYKDLYDDDGNLNPIYKDRVATVVKDAKFAAEHDGYEAFDKDGNFTILLPENSALPVDAWFALPDANGSYDESMYIKYTFWTRKDKITPVAPELVLENPEVSGTPAPAGTVTPSPIPSQTPAPVTPPRQEHQFSVYAEWMDEVVYTLPKLPNRASLPYPKTITVGPDKERAAAEEKTAAAEIREPVYVTYGSDGSYMIQLEDDAFFPYVIHFRYRLPGREEVKVPALDNRGNPVRDENGAPVMRVDPYKGNPLWKDGQIEFLTPDSQQWVNGHLFKIASTRTNPNAAVRIDLVMGNHRVPLRLAGMPDTPEKPVGGEEDMNALEEAAKLQSTQPLPEVQLYADISGVFDEEVASTRVEVYMPNRSNMQREELAKQVVWGEWDMGNYGRKDYFIPNNNAWNQLRESVHYQQLSSTTSLNLEKYSQTQREVNESGLDYQYFEVITGSGDQLDINNIRYVIRTSIVTPDYTDLLKMKVAYEDVRRGGVPIVRLREKDNNENENENDNNNENNDNNKLLPVYEPAQYYKSRGYESPTSTRGRSAYSYTTASGKVEDVDVYRITVNETWRDGKLWLTMKANEDAASYNAFKDLNAEIYEGFYFTREEVEQAAKDGKNLTTITDNTGRTLTISEVAWNQELDTQRVEKRYAYPGDFLNGFKGIEYGPKFTIVWTRKGESEPVSIMPFRVLVDVNTTAQVIVDQEQREQLPVTFGRPHTYSDFIRDDDGKMPEIKYLTSSQPEYIAEYVYPKETGDTAKPEEKASYVTSTYWTQTDGNLYDNRYYVQAAYNLNNKNWKDDGIRVFAATVPFRSVEEAEEAVRSSNDDTRAMDVTEQIFNAPGFGADYSREYVKDGKVDTKGVVFSVFNDAGTLLMHRCIQTVRREFLSFGPLSRQGMDAVKSDQAISGQLYAQNVRYELPKSEYRGIFKGRSRYTIPVTYLRDLVPSNFKDYGVKLVVGCRQAYETYDEAKKNGVDITEQAKTGASGVQEIAYTAPYRNGITFALYNAEGKLLDYRTVTAVEPEMSDQTDIYLYGANSTDGTPYKAYVMPGNMDSYFASGYQTVFILNQDNTPVTDSQIVPLFENNRVGDDGVKSRVYASVYNSGGSQAVGVLQTSGKTSLPFSAEAGAAPYHYTAAATDELNAKEYYVTYVTQQKGPKLFVNTSNAAEQMKDGIPTRQVFIQGGADSIWQDIFIANIGDEPLKNITVTFDKGANNAQEVTVDDVWKIENTVTLPAFTTTDIEEAPGHGRYDAAWPDPDVQLPNVAKIRLYPENSDKSADIDDILIIQAHDDNGNVTDESRIQLSGVVGDIKITTDYLTGPNAITPEGYDDYTKDPVKYVAFSRMIQTNRADSLDTNAVAFSITEGRLPSGFPDAAPYDPDSIPYDPYTTYGPEDNVLQQINSNGEIFGVPLETGTFTFTVTATYRYPAGSEEPIYFSQDSKTYTLTVRDNTKENVEDMISDEYEVISWIPDMIITSDEVIEGDPVIGGPGTSTKSRQDVEEVTLDGYRDVVFEYEVGKDVTNGVKDYEWVVDVYLNGKKLIKDVDYKLEQHSSDLVMLGKTVAETAQTSDKNDFDLTVDVLARQDGNSNNPNTRNASTNARLTRMNSSTPTSTPTNPTTPRPSSAPTASPTTYSGGGGGGGGGSPRRTPTPIRRNPTNTPTPSRRNPTSTPTPTPVPSYTVTVQNAQNGRVSVSSTSARRGTTVTVNTTPNKGYVTERVDVLYGGSTLTATKNVDNQYTFSMPGANVTVVGIFTPERLNGFTDLDGTNTFFDDAKWSYERGILRGTTDTTWEPDSKISSVTSIVTLGRLMDVDTSQFAGEEYRQSWIPAGEWYTPDAQWAAYYRILTPETFTGRDPIRRGSLALMLRNYLAYQGINLVVADDERVTFADMDRMSPEEVEAFQILRKAGVFLGDTDGRMYPDHDTTRGNLAAILHRIYTFMFDYWREHADDT